MTIREIHILIFCTPILDSARLKEVCAGLEEESVPYLIQFENEWKDSVDLAAEASANSPLQIGIGIDQYENVCVHHQKLARETPYLMGNLKEGREAGKNAARLVKGLPLTL